MEDEKNIKEVEFIDTYIKNIDEKKWPFVVVMHCGMKILLEYDGCSTCGGYYSDDSDFEEKYEKHYFTFIPYMYGHSYREYDFFDELGDIYVSDVPDKHSFDNNEFPYDITYRKLHLSEYDKQLLSGIDLDDRGWRYRDNKIRLVNVKKIKNGGGLFDDFTDDDIQDFLQYKLRCKIRKNQSKLLKLQKQLQEDIRNTFKQKEKLEVYSKMPSFIRLDDDNVGMHVKCTRCQHDTYITFEKHEQLLERGKTNRFCHACINNMFASNSKKNKMRYYKPHRYPFNNRK